jgi:hypothetical protein
MAKKKDLSAKQVKALSLLAAGKTQEQAALAANVKQHTLTEWMRDNVFRDELRLALERMRQTFEARVMGLANNAAVVVSEMLEDSSNQDRQLEGAKIAFNAAVRLSNRYKELQVEGYVAPAQPLVVFPAGTKFPWANQDSLPAIDVVAQVIDDEPTGDEPAQLEEGEEQ